MQCFQKDPNLRVSAKKLLKHSWIVNARRSDSVVPTQPTKYDEAVKSVQQWNEALKTPANGSLRRISRPTSSSPVAGLHEQPSVLVTPAPPKTNLALPKARASADDFRSPEGISTPTLRILSVCRKLTVLGDDNWDDDFASSISPSALNLPHLKPQDNFAGMLSPDKLKAYASFVSLGDEENWDNNFEGDLTVNESSGISDHDPLQTIRPYSAKKTSPEREEAEVRRMSERRTPSGASKPRPESPAKSQPIHKQLVSLSQPTQRYREDSVEDYSDLVATNDAVFDHHVGALRVRTLPTSSHESPANIVCSDTTMAPYYLDSSIPPTCRISLVRQAVASGDRHLPLRRTRTRRCDGRAPRSRSRGMPRMRMTRTFRISSGRKPSDRILLRARVDRSTTR